MKKLFLFALCLMFFTSCKYNEAPSMSLAKEMCSCLFIANQSKEFCDEVTKESQIMANYKVDYENKTVIAKGLGKRAEGRLNINPRFGCQIHDVRKISE